MTGSRLPVPFGESEQRTVRVAHLRQGRQAAERDHRLRQVMLERVRAHGRAHHGLVPGRWLTVQHRGQLQGGRRVLVDVIDDAGESDDDARVRERRRTLAVRVHPLDAGEVLFPFGDLGPVRLVLLGELGKVGAVPALLPAEFVARDLLGLHLRSHADDPCPVVEHRQHPVEMGSVAGRNSNSKSSTAANDTACSPRSAGHFPQSSLSMLTASRAAAAEWK